MIHDLVIFSLVTVMCSDKGKERTKSILSQGIPSKAWRFLAFFSGTLVAVLALYWVYAVVMPELKGYEKWGWLWKTFYYGLILYLGLLVFRFASSPQAGTIALGWPFQPLSDRLPRDKNIWDWLNLVGGPALLGIIASIISFFVTQSNQETASMLQDRKERQQILNDYVREMTSLIKSQPYSSMNVELKTAISTRTLNALEDLKDDHLRQGYVLRFAVRAFPDFSCTEEEIAQKVSDPTRKLSCPMPPNIDIRGIQLSNFRRSRNSKIPSDLFLGTDLRDANLKKVYLEDSRLSNVNLQGADLSEAYLDTVRLDSAAMDQWTNLSRTKLVKVDLSNTTGLNSAILDGVSISSDSVLPSNFNPCELVEDGKIAISVPIEIKQMNLDHRIKQQNLAREQFKRRYGCPPWPILQKPKDKVSEKPKG